MNAQTSFFPAFIRAEYDASSRGFPDFQRAAQSAASDARRTFEGAFADIQKTVSQSLSVPRLNGKLDLGVPQMREAVAAAEAQANAYRQVAQAAELAQREARDTSEATRLYVQAARAASIEAEQNANALRVQANAAEQLQAQLAKMPDATNRIVQSYGRFGGALNQTAEGARASRFAYVQLGQQLQDAVVQAQLGTNAFVIFTQQGSQAAYALKDMKGRVGAVANALAGPYGAAIFGVITLIGLLLPKLLETTDAFEEQRKRINDAVTAADSYGNAQSNLSKIIDLTTGKMKTQNEVLIQSVKLQAQTNILAAQAEQKKATKALGAMGQTNLTEAVTGSFTAIGRAFATSNFSTQTGADVAREREARLAPIKSVLDEYSKLANTPGVAQDTLNKALDVTIDRLDALGKSGKTAGRDLIEAKRTVIELATSLNDQNANKLVLDAANGKPLDPRLKPYERAKKPRDNSRRVTALDEFATGAKNQVDAIIGRFDDAPRLIDQAAAAQRELDAIYQKVQNRNAEMMKLTGKGLPGFSEIIAQIGKARETVEQGVTRPYRDFIDQQQESLQIQKLLSKGMEDEAAAQQVVFQLERQMGPLREDQKQAVLDTVVALRLQARETEILRQKQQNYLNAVEQVRSSIEQAIASAPDRGLKSLGDLAGSIRQSFNQLFAKTLTEKLFGDEFRKLQDQITGADKVDRASGVIVDSFKTVSDSALSLADSMSAAAVRLANPGASASTLGLLSGGSGVASGANAVLRSILLGGASGGSSASGLQSLGSILSGSNDIIVNGPSRDKMTATQLFSQVATKLLKGVGVSDEAASKIGKFAGKGFEGAAVGGLVNGVLAPLGKALGVKTSQTGAQIGGAIGSVVPIPGGSIVGSVIGSIVGGLFKSTPKASATIGGSGNQLVVSSLTGNKANLKAAASDSADSAITTLQRIADQLGVSIDASRGSVSIGVRKGNYRVDTTGSGRTKLKAGVLDFGDDATAAVKAATMDLIRDGVLVGLRASTQRLILQAKDIDTALDKATKFESVFTALKAIEDPVGAAIDTVDKQFTELRNIFAEAGASAEELASLEKLYSYQRVDAVKQASEAMTSTLKGLLNDLTTGDNGKSLSDRLSSALATYNPLASDLAAGKKVDYDAFAEAARTVLDIQRQLSGSQDDYFKRLDEVTGLTQKALQDQENIISLATAKDPLISSTASTATNDNTPVVNALADLGDTLVGALGSQLAAVNANLGLLITKAGGSSGGGGILSSNIKNF